ncbi:MAG: DUF5050 domain-containing protein [Phycisphaerae bacterium]
MTKHTQGLRCFAAVALSLVGISSPATAQTLFWTDVGTRLIQQGNLQGENLEVLVVNQVGPRGFDLDIANNRVYYADDSSLGSAQDAIRSANLDGTDVVELIDATTPYALTLDLTNGHIYYSDVDGITRTTLDGSDPETLIATGVVSRDIQIDLDAGKIYWCQSNLIRRANLDGSDAESLYEGPFVTISNIEIDVDNQTMFWTESAFGFGDIYRSGIEVPKGDTPGNRSDVEFVDVGTVLRDPRGLALSPNGSEIYWSDRVDDVIRRAPADGGSFEDLVTAGLGDPVYIRLDVDNQKMYWSDFGIDAISRSGINGQGIQTVVDDLNFPVGIAVDFCDRKIYWADSGTNAIRRSNLDGSEEESIVEQNADDIQSLALDTNTGMLYWSDNASNLILRAPKEVPQGETPSNRTDIEELVADFGSLAGIAIDKDNGYLFWADRSSNRVLRAGLDLPKNQTPQTRDDILEIAADLDEPYGVTLDVARERVYWVDDGTNTLQSASYESGDVQDVITSGLVQPRGVAFDRVTDSLFWTDLTLGTVNRSDLDGGNPSVLYGESLDEVWGIIVALPEISRSDHQLFINCFAGPVVPAVDVCSCYDLNADSFVDLMDYAVEQNVITVP